MSTSLLQIERVQQISICVHELERAVAFYRDILNLPLQFQVPGMAFFDCSGLRLLLAVPENPQFAQPSSTVYFRVDEIQTAYEELAKQGVELIGKPHKIAEMGGVETWMAFFKDSEANVHALTSEVPKR